MISKELKEEIERMKKLPWDYSHLFDCLCGSDDLNISEFSNGNLDDGMYCGSVECNKCGKVIHNTSKESADIIWNRVNSKN